MARSLGWATTLACLAAVGCAGVVDYLPDDGLLERMKPEEACRRLAEVLERAENVWEVEEVTPALYSYRGNLQSGFLWSRMLGERVPFLSIVRLDLYEDHEVHVQGDAFGDDLCLLDVQQFASEEEAKRFMDLVASFSRTDD